MWQKKIYEKWEIFPEEELTDLDRFRRYQHRIMQARRKQYDYDEIGRVLTEELDNNKTIKI
jgi:hypothetical protein